MNDMRVAVVLLLVAACSKDQPKAAFRASCKPDANHDHVMCTVENTGKKAARACVTSREQVVPKKKTLVAQRTCTKILAPGESQTVKARYDGLESLQPLCAPDGEWLCRDEIVESPEMLGENIPGQKE
jgi:hypothetical protein